jgi:hypothetical protein
MVFRLIYCFCTKKLIIMDYFRLWMANNPRPLILLVVMLDRHDGQLSTNKMLRLMGSHEYHPILKLAEKLGLITREKVQDQPFPIRRQPRTGRYEWQLLAQLDQKYDFESDPIIFSFKQQRTPVNSWDVSSLVNKLTLLGKQLAQQAREADFLTVTKTGRYRP